MTLTDYLLDSLLVLLVLRQIRESRFDRRAVLLPVVICAVVGQQYLHAVPTAAADVLLVSALIGVGLLLGTASGLTTRVRNVGGTALVKAGGVAAVLWVLGMGSRFGFAVWATHGGGPVLGRFSAAHGISGAAWTTALVLMALAEVLSRTAILWTRARRVVRQPEPEHALVTV